MEKFKALIDLNAAINKYFEKESLAAGNVRYWDKLFVTMEMLNDEELVSVFYKVFEPTINTLDVEQNKRDIHERRTKTKETRIQQKVS